LSEWRKDRGEYEYKLNTQYPVYEHEIYSKSDQENFVINLLKSVNNYKEKTEGYYVELGANHPIEGSNTYVLENRFNWTGVSFEILEEFQLMHKDIRKNPCLLQDAKTFDYKKYFEENNFPKQIDFLQIDIDEGFDKHGRQTGDLNSSLHGLIQLPLNEYRFSIITYEHEALNDFKKNSERDAQREILSSYGYALVVRNWHDDWWVDPNVIPYEKFKDLYKMAAP